MTPRMAPLLSTCLILGLLSLAAAHAQDNRETQPDWQFFVSAGAFVSPTYLGDDSYQVSVFPNLAVQYRNRFRASLLEGMTYSLFDNNGLSAGPVARFNFGRDEDGSNPLGIGGETTDLVGFGDIDFTVEVGAFVKYRQQRFSAALEVRQAVSGHDGLVGEAEVKYNGTFELVGKRAFYSVGPEITYGDGAFNSAFFDVNPEQSDASGLPAYDASGGLNAAGVQALLLLPLTGKMTLTGFAGLSSLLGESADSPLVQQRGSETQGIGGVFFNYRF